MKNKEKFENLDSTKLSLTTLHKGRPIKYPETNNKLIDYIEFNRKLGLPITTWALLIELYKLEPERKEMNIKANLQLLYRFMERYGFSFRSATHIGQKVNKDALTQASLFYNEVHTTINENGFNTYNIFNMDESPIFFNMVPNKTIAKKGKKTIIIKTQNQQKCRISILLGIGADGSKLMPLLIFKGKTGGYIETELSKNKYVLNKKCLISVNQNAWATDTIIKKWFYNIWIKYIKNPENLCDNTGYLILDRATSHMTPDILDTFKTNILIDLI